MSQEHFNVVVVGAGISGIGAGYHLQKKMSRQILCNPRKKTKHRWDLGSIPFSRYQIGLRYAYNGL